MSARQPLADTLFISDFAAFCRTKGDEAYDFGDNYNCACAQFLKASGRAKRPIVGETFWTEAGEHGGFIDIPKLAVPAIKHGSRTFSALATRLESLIADSPLVERG